MQVQVQVQLHHVHIFASDIQTTLGFWKNMFGAQVLFDMEIAGARNVMIAIGLGRINIYDQPPRDGNGGAYHHLGIQTDDLDAPVEHMKGQGFQFQGQIREHGYLRYIMAMAPDKILLEIFQILPEKASADRQEVLRRAFAF
jgi:catechol 2,3-dioxygenase-like lactoylglutathione lyase family enzyme